MSVGKPLPGSGPSGRSPANVPAGIRLLVGIHVHPSVCLGLQINDASNGFHQKDPLPAYSALSAVSVEGTPSGIQSSLSRLIFHKNRKGLPIRAAPDLPNRPLSA